MGGTEPAGASDGGTPPEPPDGDESPTPPEGNGPPGPPEGNGPPGPPEPTDPETPPDGPATISLLVADDANRRVLADWLADEPGWTVVASADGPGPDDDCCVVDDAGLRGHRAALARWSADGDVFRPCLLASERGEAALSADADGLVDDVVELPTTMAVLRRRLGRLLAAREQSRRLDAERRSLREQNERLRTFAGRLAHDLRNPLGIARGYVERAADAGDGDDLGVAAGALDRMGRLIDETLMLAKMGETAVDRRELSLAAVARRAWRHVDTADGHLAVEDDARFEADESRVEELFENCFRNAVEHGSTSPRSQAREDAVEHGSADGRPAADDAEQGGHGVAVRVGVLDGGEGFYVADDGPGITEGDREQVFEVGYTTHEDGTGFGLRIVREIVEAHGWDVTVAEGADGGARFEVTGVEFDPAG